jgi:hypothetical protein
MCLPFLSRNMILFLDFDGVLHPFPMGPSDKPFSAILPLWSILEASPNLSVVITSTWREKHAFEDLVALLVARGGERFSDRFLGTTPIMESSADYEPGIRQREIESWLADNAPPNTPYLILDDIEEYFDANCKNLYLVDGTTGLTERDVGMVAMWLSA